MHCQPALLASPFAFRLSPFRLFIRIRSLLRVTSTMALRKINKTSMRLATLVTSAIACGSAHAQSSVTLYGAIDTGVRYINNATAQGGSTWSLGSGALMGSRWGIKGREDLGNGTSANFVLESGFLPTTGGFDQQGQQFGRQAWVGIDNKTYGTLQAGRMYSLGFWQLSNYDAFNLPNYLSEAWETRLYGVRMDNTVKYTFSRDDVTLQYQHSFGGQAGDFQAGTTNAAALSYSAHGFGAGVEAQRSTDGGDRHANVLGAGATYTFANSLTFYGTYIYSRRDAGFTIGSTTGSALANTSILSNATTVLGAQTTGRRDAYFSAGVAYRIVPALRIGAQLMLDNVAGVTGGTGGRIKTLVSLVDYQLSKRTDVYAEFDRSVLSGGSVTDLNSPVGTFHGHANQTGVTLGLRTLF
jgi:predicted porin